MYFDRQEKEETFDIKTLEKIEQLVGEIRHSVHLSNSPYNSNEQIVNPYLDAVIDEIDNLKGKP